MMISLLLVFFLKDTHWFDITVTPWKTSVFLTTLKIDAWKNEFTSLGWYLSGHVNFRVGDCSKLFCNQEMSDA